MAATLIWTTSALRDIAAIADYIRLDAPQYADRVVERIFALEDSIQTFPEMGRVVPEQENTAVRERFVFSYRVIYRIAPEHIYVMSVFHMSRLLDPTQLHG